MNDPDPVGGQLTSPPRRRVRPASVASVAVVLVIGIVVGWMIGTPDGDGPATDPSAEAVEGTDEDLAAFVDGGGVTVEADEGFTVRMPIEPTRRQERIGAVEVTNYSATAGTSSFSVIVFDYPPSEEVPDDLEGLVGVIAAQAGAKVDLVVPGDDPSSVDYRLVQSDGTFSHGRYVLSGRVLYQLIVVSGETDPDGLDAFQGSFELDDD